MFFRTMGKKVFFRFSKFSFLTFLWPFFTFFRVFSSLSLYWPQATPFDLQTQFWHVGSLWHRKNKKKLLKIFIFDDLRAIFDNFDDFIEFFTSWNRNIMAQEHNVLINIIFRSLLSLLSRHVFNSFSKF